MNTMYRDAVVEAHDLGRKQASQALVAIKRYLAELSRRAHANLTTDHDQRVMIAKKYGLA